MTDGITNSVLPDAKGQPAVVLLSGGLDSTTVLALAKAAGYRCHCLSFRYGQRHTQELELARANARHWGAARHLILNIELDAIGGSALTGDELEVPKDNLSPLDSPDGAETDAPGMAGEVPVTYVPGRNTIFLAYAASWAEVLGARDIFIGVNAVDFSGYPDCRPDYLEALAAALNLGSQCGREGRPFRLQAPLLHLSKAEIIAKGLALGVDYARTHSCYDPDQQHRACGRCDACILRRRGFAAAGCPDPTTYQPARSE
ncbi:7-cyano-7-deazaguanine synthase QueC [Desulfurivibrio alkaliphilus]|uniref:7-cyano-7-deazaguanine synthase n=1 Tax=Desulfurivibrio alkaliphilus (strain DSM 19089 / UNIQEM U267 / AHT2) TaxID=589865 RepID=D6Z744_DESAT|nr:7-cyano-7-deazaguanine synthase QueC [Desulfurivibrio alkaliphilus]ADH87031.1 exsB protein [Desulfurivibrio alkaliphilus AHT 2]